MEFRRVVLRTLVEAGVRPGDAVGAAVSGGSDSTALAVLLADVAPEAGIEVHLLHVDHRLRPDSASDAERVAALARDLGLGYRIRTLDVPRRRRSSLEADARDARYEALEGLADELGLSWIATGHTADDQAETVLLRILRGTGVGGLGAIPPVRGRVIRPLLDARRSDLQDLLRERGIAWATDPTNEDLSRDRNWVRHVVLPSLASRRSGVARTLARLADHARDDDAFLDSLAVDLWERAATAEGWVVCPPGTDAIPDPVLVRVARRILVHLGAPVRTETIDAVVAAARGATTHPTDDLTATSLEGRLLVCRRAMSAPDPVPLPGSGTKTLDAYGLRVRVGPGPAREPGGWRCLVPAGRLEVRPRLPGDRVPTAVGTRKVSDVLVDAKVPRELRSAVGVLTRAGEPLAVVGWTVPPVGSVPDGASGPGGAAVPGETVAVDVEPVPGGLWEATGLWSRATARRTS